MAGRWLIRSYVRERRSVPSLCQNSDAEFSVAQGIYVETNSGWFSDRTTRYLASGKPVLVQDTGFSRNLPTERACLHSQSDEAVAGAAEIASQL